VRSVSLWGAVVVLLCSPLHCAAMGSGPHPHVPFGIPPVVRHAPNAQPGVPWHAGHWAVFLFCVTPILLLVTAEFFTWVFKTPRK
jgi:hypothetical protein